MQNSIRSDDDLPNPDPTVPGHRTFATLVAVFALIAIAAAGYLLRSFLLKTYGVDAFDSACSINETFNCDKINTSVWGKLGGIPITIFAIPTYAAFVVLAWFGRGSGPTARAALQLVRVGAGLGLAYGLFLLYVMVAIEQTYCLFCLTMDAMALLMVLAAGYGLRRMGPGASSPGKPIGVAAVVGLLVLGAAYGYHDSTKTSLLAEASAAADKAAADAEAAREKLDAAPAGAAASAAGESASAAAAGTPAAPVGQARKISDSLYEVPVHPDDPSIGPADAKVTVVEYADFQCGYCKKLFYSLQNTKRRYKDRVRFVFKHFPMNTLCNPHIQNNRHKYACNAALASECARRQGKFWEMHDVLFKNQHKLESDDLRYYAQSVGLDMEQYATCMRAPEPRNNLKRTIDEGGEGLGLKATPRTFINGLMLSGALPEEILARFIDKELQKAGTTAPAAAAPAADAVAPATTDAPKEGMAQVKTATGSFWIDRYEASIDKDGRALSLAGVVPANATWYEAQTACSKAGKRLCTSAEWVTACAGKDAIDNDGNGNYADDYVEGNQFPYADYHEQGFCYVDGDRRDGRPRETGSSPKCVTPSGVFDLAGNVEEWIEATEAAAQLVGGDYRAGDKASCVRGHRSFGPGHRSHGIGFRCCADAEVANKGSAPVPHAVPDSVVGQPVPHFDALQEDGRPLTPNDLKGKVTFLTFFASWCGPCRRELPELGAMVEALGAKGFQVVAVGVDTDAADSRAFVAGLGKLPVTVIYDPNAKALGRFDVTNMPTGYLIDRKGIIRHKQVGFGDKTRAELESAILPLL